MDKNKKKAGNVGPKAPKLLTEYKSREAEGTASKADAAFNKGFGKTKGIPRNS